MPAYKIADLVKRDQKAEFRNDVQISSYDDKERNQSLVSSYLFTSEAPTGTVSSASVLLSAIQTFLNERLENRSVVIATFGHGKSHLALAVANYFGRSANSDAYKTVLEKISKAFSGSSNFKTYQQFKEGRGEFIIVRLRGDVPGSLREQFLTSLEKELNEHTMSKNHRLPSWYAKAEKYLTGLEGKELKKANAFLEKFEVDVPMLLQNVKHKQDSAYDRFIDLYAHLDEHGFKPNMEGELSLAYAVEWAVKEFCGEGKLGGVVVLFDEFSLYIEKYAQRSAAGDLQDLLNGVDKCRGRSIFLAFAQQDPITVAQNALTGSSSNQRESLVKELTRIPQKFILHSLMESVIGSYLEQPNDKWQKFIQESNVSTLISQATNVALDQFKDRYNKLGWTSIQKFEESVTKGCFPLHPITTAMLCNMQFQSSVTASGTPRNILGFILEQLDSLQDKQALVGRRINWVLPIYLVDYFGERLPAERYHAYQQALERITVDDEKSVFSPEDQIDALKAILLQEIAGLKARDDDQIDLIASMIGMPPSDAKKCLRLLSDSKVIAWNHDGRKSYSLWASSFNPYKLDQILERKVKDANITYKNLLDLSPDYLGATQVSVPWGNSLDWQSFEYVLTAEHFNAKTLKDLVNYFSYDAKNGLQEGDRGCIIWLVAQNQDDVSLFKQSAQKTLDEAFPESDPLPVVLLLPIHENSLLINSMRNKKTLDSFTQTDKDDCGLDVFNARLAQEKTNIQQAILNMRGGDNYSDTPRFHTQFVVPKPYKAHIQQLENISLQRLLESIYRIAYRFAPPEFFIQYPISATKFRSAVKTVAIDILNSDAGSLGGTIRSSSIANDLAKLLVQKWKIITTDNRVKIPNEERISTAWEILDNSFPAGGGENLVKSILLSLLNPPYGYDYNTVVLIFCAWFGFNSHNLQIITNGTVTNIKQLDQRLQSGPKEFVQFLLDEKIALGRRDATKATKEIKALLAKVKSGGLTKKEAQDIWAKFEDFASSDKNDASLVEDARKGMISIKDSLEMAQSYETQAGKVLSAINRERNIKNLAALLDALTSMSENTLVLADAPSVKEIRNKVQKWLEEVVKSQCSENEEIDDIADLGLHRRELDVLRQELTRLKLPALAEQAKASLVKLEKNAGLLQAHQQETSIQNEIRMMHPNANLKDLLVFRAQLTKYEGLSKETEKIRSDRLRIVENEIKRVEEVVDNAEKYLGQIDNRQDLDELRGSLSNLAPRLEDTAFAKKLQKPLASAVLINNFFNDLWKIENSSMRTEEDVEDLKGNLREISKKYSKAISDKQKKAIEKVEINIDKRVREYEQQASLLIDELEKSFITKGVNLVELRTRLERPISFLPEKAEKRLGGLVQKVDKKLDEDVISQIELSFRKIKDKKIRQECIKRLTEIVKE